MGDCWWNHRRCVRIRWGGVKLIPDLGEDWSKVGAIAEGIRNRKKWYVNGLLGGNKRQTDVLYDMGFAR